jgi:hypothetical protein
VVVDTGSEIFGDVPNIAARAQALAEPGSVVVTARVRRDLFSYSSDLLTRAVGELLRRAGAAGEIRNDISPEDLLRALVGMCYTHDQTGWQKNVLRLVDVFIDGLRNRGSNSPSSKIHSMTPSERGGQSQ